MKTKAKTSHNIVLAHMPNKILYFAFGFRLLKEKQFLYLASAEVRHVASTWTSAETLLTHRV